MYISQEPHSFKDSFTEFISILDVPQACIYVCLFIENTEGRRKAGWEAAPAALPQVGLSLQHPLWTNTSLSAPGTQNPGSLQSLFQCLIAHTHFNIQINLLENELAFYKQLLSKKSVTQSFCVPPYKFQDVFIILLQFSFKGWLMSPSQRLQLSNIIIPPHVKIFQFVQLLLKLWGLLMLWAWACTAMSVSIPDLQALSSSKESFQRRKISL